MGLIKDNNNKQKLLRGLASRICWLRLLINNSSLFFSDTSEDTALRARNPCKPPPAAILETYY